MSTIVRSSSGSRGGRADRGDRGDRLDGPDGARGARRGGRESQRPLAGRALRVRNACVCHAAVRLGLPAPTDAELRELPADAGLGEAVEWWRARAPGALEFAERPAGLGLAVRTAVVVGVTLIGLAFSYGQAQ